MATEGRSEWPWRQAPARQALGAHEIHLWRARLEVAPGRREQLAALLAADERQRAERFVFPADRDRFVAAHGLLRLTLGRYGDTPPDGLRFTCGPQGKPELAGESGPAALCFNLSHSRQLALIAVARGRPVGVDVEWQRDDVAREQIADRFFSPREAATLRALPQAERLAAFYGYWTSKEAYAKAWGEGLRLGLDQVEVELAPPRLVSAGDGAELAGWPLWLPTVSPGYAAAVVAKGCGLSLSCWDADHVLD
jgi:4'-phosphopantetheinyl transferase